jgi:hypothetical protein
MAHLPAEVWEELARRQRPHLVVKVVLTSGGISRFIVASFPDETSAKRYVLGRKAERPFLSDWYWTQDTPAERRRVEKEIR